MNAAERKQENAEHRRVNIELWAKTRELIDAWLETDGQHGSAEVRQAARMADPMIVAKRWGELGGGYSEDMVTGCNLWTQFPTEHEGSVRTVADALVSNLRNCIDSACEEIDEIFASPEWFGPVHEYVQNIVRQTMVHGLRLQGIEWSAPQVVPSLDDIRCWGSPRWGYRLEQAPRVEVETVRMVRPRVEPNSEEFRGVVLRKFAEAEQDSETLGQILCDLFAEGGFALTLADPARPYVGAHHKPSVALLTAFVYRALQRGRFALLPNVDSPMEVPTRGTTECEVCTCVVYPRDTRKTCLDCLELSGIDLPEDLA